MEEILPGPGLFQGVKVTLTGRNCDVENRDVRRNRDVEIVTWLIDVTCHANYSMIVTQITKTLPQRAILTDQPHLLKSRKPKPYFSTIASCSFPFLDSAILAVTKEHLSELRQFIDILAGFQSRGSSD